MQYGGDVCVYIYVYVYVYVNIYIYIYLFISPWPVISHAWHTISMNEIMNIPKNEVISVDWYIIEPFIVVVYT